MIPVTLGLGLINVNARDRLALRVAADRPELAPTAIDKAFRLYMLPQGMFSVAVATVLFPSLVAPGDARRTSTGFRAHRLRSACARSRFLLVPAGVVSRRARRADRPARLPARRVHARPDARRRRAPRRVLARARRSTGAMLMLNRAFFSLQSNWIPTAVALGEPRAQRAALLRVLPRSAPGGSRSRSRIANIAGVRERCSSCCAAGSGGSTSARPRDVVRPHRASPRPCSPPSRTASGAGSTSASARLVGAQIVSLGAALAAGAAVYLRSLPVAGGARARGAALVARPFRRAA